MEYKICTNCESTLHDYNSCKEPKTSWGIILVKIFNNEDLKLEHSKVKTITEIKKLEIKTEEEIKKYSNLMSSIKFLMISRKHSLTFIEFVRGRYKEDNVNGLKGLFELMMEDEIELIKNNDFDNIWNSFWLDNDYKLKLKVEYHESKNKFNKLKYKTNNIKYGLEYYTENIKPKYNIPEWGLPKGRKKFGETNLECAIREFTEETQIKETDIKIIDSLDPIIENMQGTDGKQYKHIYYIAELISNDLNIKITSNEVKNMGFFSYLDACTILRPYHSKKRYILELITEYYLSLIIN